VASLGEHIAARLAYLHARRVFAKFERALRDVERVQANVLRRVLRVVAGGGYAAAHGLERVRTVADLRQAAPLVRYDDLRPYIERQAQGSPGALLAPGQQVRMFATSSGTTSEPKLIPVTRAFVDDYRRGWNTFGLKMLGDHPRAILRAILQSTGRYDAERTEAGIPCGAITGLLAREQKRIVRRFYVGRPDVAQLSDPQARYYTLMRYGVARDVSFAITANPATLIRMAQTADAHADALIRDVRDGTLSDHIEAGAKLREALCAGLRPDAARAGALERLRSARGRLLPRDMWNLSFLACWTGGSMGHYLTRLAEWWGPVPVRDLGLLASEGRVSVPLEDNTPVGVLDVTSGIFEFIPAEEAEADAPPTLNPREVEVGRDYAVVLTNTSGLVRYRLGDVVRVRGWLHQAPLVEFLYRAGRVASVAGEKLTENQVVSALQAACAELGIAELDFVLAPAWADPPHYRLTCTAPAAAPLAAAVDRALSGQNEEYASRRRSSRLGPVDLRTLPEEAFAAMDRHLTQARRSAAEQYKRPCLFTEPDADDQALGLGR
jgi:hypothetical protein